MDLHNAKRSDGTIKDGFFFLGGSVSQLVACECRSGGCIERHDRFRMIHMVEVGLVLGLG